MMPDVDLRAVEHALARRAHAGVHRRFLSRLADGLDLDQLFGPAEQIAAALKGFAAKIRAKPVGQHRNMQAIDHQGELKHLAFAQKLGFIDQDAVDRRLGGQLLHPRVEIGLRIKDLGLARQPDPRGDPADPVAIVDPRRKEERPHALLFVVVGRLEKRGALARVHG